MGTNTSRILGARNCDRTLPRKYIAENQVSWLDPEYTLISDIETAERWLMESPLSKRSNPKLIVGLVWGDCNRPANDWSQFCHWHAGRFHYHLRETRAEHRGEFGFLLFGSFSESFQPR